MPTSDTTVYTKTNRKWLMKMGVAAVFALVLFVWGLIDATVVYPNQGINDASYKQKEYLRLAKSSPGRLAATSIADPQARFAKLKGMEAELAKTKSAAAAADAKGPGAQAERITLLAGVIDAAEYDWLASLKLVGRLKPEYTTIPNPEATFTELDSFWNKTDPPKALAAYDLPLQWGLTAAGLIWFGYLVALYVKVKRTRYGWDAAERRLHLPDGSEVLPTDITELDKRKWDKFYVTLMLVGGRSVLLDLYRFDPLEEWILAMEGNTDEGDEGEGKGEGEGTGEGGGEGKPAGPAEPAGMANGASESPDSQNVTDVGVSAATDKA